MLGFLGGLFRVIIGFVLASLAAGAVQVLFAVTPAELIDAGMPYWNQGGLWVLESATIIGIFSAPFALLSAAFSEWQGIRSFAYHGFVGIAIAVGGFALITMGETPDAPSIINSYAMAAFLTTGLIGGFAYWLFSGRYAYRPQPVIDTTATFEPPKPAQRPTPEKLDLDKLPPLKPRSADQSKPSAPAKPEQQLSAGGSVPATKPKAGKTYDA